MDGLSLGACSAQSRAVPFPVTLAKSIWQGLAAPVSGCKNGLGCSCLWEWVLPAVLPCRSDTRLGGETEAGLFSWGMGRGAGPWCLTGDGGSPGCG